jgi:cell division protein FtsX
MDLQIQDLCLSLLIEPFKEILHCHWLIFSTHLQRGIFINTALVFTSECLLFLPAIFENILDNVQFAIAANDLESLQCLYTELENNIDASRTNSVDELLSSVSTINTTSRSLARNFGAKNYIAKYVQDKKDKVCTAIK